VPQGKFPVSQVALHHLVSSIPWLFWLLEKKVSGFLKRKSFESEKAGNFGKFLAAKVCEQTRIQASFANRNR
jgi:hypothetical protein